MTQTHNMATRPTAFPLHEKQHYITEREWVIWKLLCRPLSTLPENTPEELSIATGGQISVERCDELIRITNINNLSGIGTWISRLLAQSGFDVNDVCDKPAEELLGKINSRLGYELCNAATIQSFAALQQQWHSEEQQASLEVQPL